jgi:preprotein translocase subunit SecA
VQEAKPQLKKNNPKIQTSREEIATGISEVQGSTPEAAAPKPTQNPIINELKIGRNDPCPCGSGKKFKACHGKD